MKVQIGEKKKAFLSEKMFGLFFEDINYGADGGLYAEMIENRQFAFRKASFGKAEKTYDAVYAGDYGWKVYPEDGPGKMTFPEGDAVSDCNPHYMQFHAPLQGGAFSNKAYDGICLKTGMQYAFTLWLRSEAFEGTIQVCVLNGQGKKVLEESLKVTKTEGWQQYTFAATAKDQVKNGTFIIRQSEGCLDYGYISMMPKDAVYGVFRRDLFHMLQDMKPGFLRFPGGCIVEGANLDNRYRWKDTVGEPWERRWNWSRWAVHDVTMGQGNPLFYPFYNQSYGIGFYEYFLLSELLGAKPLPVLSVGLACQFQSDELVPVNDPEFQRYLQDALDLIEFANGDANSKWGAVRAKMGHEEPFGLEYIGIGNEQWETERVDFFARYQAFEKAIHAVYPKIQLIGTAGPDVTTEKYTRAWDFFKAEYEKNKDFTAAVDEHYYMPPAWFYEHVDMYDSYSRDIPVFAGEYAAHTQGKRNNWEAALAEASFMCGLERNGDVIRFASAAPLFAREGYAQWIPDYIWFDGEDAMGTPGYYVQKLFGAYTGKASVEYRTMEAPQGMYSALSEDEQCYYLKLVNAGEKPVVLEAVMAGEENISLANASCYQMASEDLKAENKLGEPERIALRKACTEEKTVLLPRYSCTVIVWDK